MFITRPRELKGGVLGNSTGLHGRCSREAVLIRPVVRRLLIPKSTLRALHTTRGITSQGWVVGLYFVMVPTFFLYHPEGGTIFKFAGGIS